MTATVVKERKWAEDYSFSEEIAKLVVKCLAFSLIFLIVFSAVAAVHRFM